jgi:hypothetical protein
MLKLLKFLWTCFSLARPRGLDKTELETLADDSVRPPADIPRRTLSHRNQRDGMITNTQAAKIFLICNGLTIAEIARRIAPEWGATEESLRIMITDMVNGRRFYPRLAAKVEATVGLRLERPKHLQPLPNRQAA